MSDAPLRLYGRRTSHFTRVVLVVAHEVEVPLELVHVEDLFSLDPNLYGGHPALKVPCLHVGDATHFGAENCAMRVARSSAFAARITWPEAIDDDLVCNAQELVWTAMGLEVQVVLGTIVSRELDAEDRQRDRLLHKSRVALASVLAWLDARLDSIFAALPADRDTSLLEITLFCLVEHVALQSTAPLDAHPRLLAFAQAFGARPSAHATTPK